MDVTIRGITFPDIDFTDADVMEAYTDGIADIQSMKDDAPADAKDTASFIRDICDALRNLFDNVLGEGAGDQILVKDSMKEGIIAFAELVQAEKQASEELHSIWKEFEQNGPEPPPTAPLSRQQRRQQQRDKKKKENQSRRARPTSTSGLADPYSPERLET